MDNERTIGFGLLGAGLIAPFHAKSIQAAAGCELIAVADLDVARAKKIANQFNCKACGTLDEMLSDDRIDAINILTPNHLHCEATIAAAKAGKHVLVEKPPAMSLKETDAMIDACQSARVKLGIVLQCRVRKPIRAMRKAIDAGRFGTLIQADAYMKWYRTEEYYLSDDWRGSRKSGAGVTIQHAFHYIDLLQYLMGPARRVLGRMSNRAHPQVELEDTLNAIIDFENGAQGVVVASTAMFPGTDIRIEVSGTNGTAVMVGEHMETWQFRDEQSADQEIRNVGRESVSTAASGPADFDFADHQVIIEDLAAAIGEDRDPIVSAQSARQTLHIALAMYKSAASGHAVEMPITDEESIW